MLTPFYDNELKLWHVHSSDASKGYPLIASFTECWMAEYFVSFGVKP